MKLKQLGIEYIRTAKMLRDRARTLHEADSAEAAALRARITELRAVAVQLSKYGRYLCEYYREEGDDHAE